MFIYLEQILLSWAGHIPLVIFAPVVSFIEEVIPPIPSPSVTIATGSIAQVQDYTMLGLVVLALLAAVGKTVGACIVYFISDKVEDLLSGKIANFIGITHEQIETFGSRLGKGWRDWLILTTLRALPIVPSVLVSVGGGLLKVRFRLFLITTFIGSVIRGFIYIYLGYIGTDLISSFVKSTTTIESIIQILVVLIIIVIIGYMYLKRRKAGY
jgi:membrane protein DedA with SNARE-associated domain